MMHHSSDHSLFHSSFVEMVFDARCNEVSSSIAKRIVDSLKIHRGKVLGNELTLPGQLRQAKA